MPRAGVLVSVVAALAATLACGSSTPASPSPAPAPAPGPAPTPAPSPSPPPAPVVMFGPGQHRVGSDIQPGRYFSAPTASCYWERQSGPGGTARETIAFALVDFDAAQWVVDILPSDYSFMSRTSCGNWFSTQRQALTGSIPPGVWIVGGQVTPGMYQSSVSAGCHWERLRNFTGQPDAVIASDLIGSSGTQFVTINASDAGFRSDAPCGTWSRASSTTARHVR